jgi:diguanylate cyclase (GGDEF)-like protein
VADPGRPGLERVAVWGPLAPEGVPLFGPDDCWALRRGRPHVVEDAVAGLACPHLRQAVPSAYLCVPLLAQGETLGLLHLASGVPAGAGGRRAGRPLWTEAKQRLMTTVPEQLGLALANLRLREKLRSESIRDALTGLFNRRYMEESLDLELARAERGRHPVGVVLVDVDHFKRVNDTYGHAGGDAVLAALGALLRASVRGGDLACRLGGEEFLLILPGTPLVELARRAEELRAAVRGVQVVHHGQPLGPITVSMGVAAAPDHGTTRDALLRAADAALYRAKAAGRDRIA